MNIYFIFSVPGDIVIKYQAAHYYRILLASLHGITGLEQTFLYNKGIIDLSRGLRILAGYLSCYLKLLNIYIILGNFPVAVIRLIVCIISITMVLPEDLSIIEYNMLALVP
ncbi:hypothetical protein BD770DRAFT_407311 [Pilaira anomala]|nr:hypothetical protein BD770DRAFT_407311 [Pilaira anomala]